MESCDELKIWKGTNDGEGFAIYVQANGTVSPQE